MTQHRPFHKVLVANRGEIACRVIRTAQSLGFDTVAVFSEADRHAPHVQLADQAVCIGPATVSESYLRADAILEACRKTGADAVHPGYGFLSENSAFAAACEEAGIVFIGPPQTAIELMGSKRLSKIAMLEADVPCIPGYEGADQSEDTLIREARRMGFPLMLKASAGGGGRGMRLVSDEQDLPAQIKTASSEAKNAFGSGELILEKALIEPRHIEIQVFADQHGNAVYLGERDCSVQRRHQKVVEEAPSPFVDEDLRQRMGKAAVQAALSCNYVGAGTVEFLVDQDRNFYFLEMNTRLQVEHPVTELITGQDLVAWQIRVAAGQKLPLSQDAISLKGHAIEVRLYAEDPAQNFMPQTGQIKRWRFAEQEGLRVDDGICEGQWVTPHYDPMLAKVIAWGEDRSEAIRRLLRSLQKLRLFGVTSNQFFLSRILAHPAFQRGEATTAFIPQHMEGDPSLTRADADPVAIALSAIILCHQQYPDKSSLHQWWSANVSPWVVKLQDGEKQRSVTVLPKADGYEVSLSGESDPIRFGTTRSSDEQVAFEHEGIHQQAAFLCEGARIFLLHQGRTWQFEDCTHQPSGALESGGSGQVKASMDGAIVDVLVEAGQTVRKGETVVILEAMKMEHPLKADCDGTVSELSVKPGDQVRVRQILVTIEPSANDG